MCCERVVGGEGLVGTAGACSMGEMRKTASHPWRLSQVEPGEGKNPPRPQRSSSDLEILRRGFQRVVNRELLRKV